jgi:hypothetical protein
METVKISPSRNANEVVLVANTPSFIFKRLREDSVVRYIADTHSAQEISEWFATHSEKPEQAEELVLRYMYLVALSMKDAKDVSELIGRIPLDSIHWGKEIAELAASRAKPTTMISLDAPTTKRTPMSSTASTGIFIPDTKGFQIRWVK